MAHLPPVALASQSPARRPSETKSEAISVAYRSSGAFTPRSTSTTGMFALGLAEHRLPAGFDDRREDDRVHPLRDEGPQGADLVLLFPLGVDDFQVHPGFGPLAATDLVSAVSPALGADLGKAHGHLAAAALGQRRCARRAALVLATTWFAAGVAVPEASTVFDGAVWVAAELVAGPGRAVEAVLSRRSTAPADQAQRGQDECNRQRPLAEHGGPFCWFVRQCDIVFVHALEWQDATTPGPERSGRPGFFFRSRRKNPGPSLALRTRRG